MYDFYFGSREQVDADPRTFLLTVKRMLPRWANGVPDSEMLALYDLLEQLEAEGLPARHPDAVLAETGSGASTLVLAHFALRWGTQLYSWDINGSKLAFLRGVLNDTLLRQHRHRNLWNHWHPVAFDSLSPLAGIPVLGEMGRGVLGCFLDSEHTWRVLGGELERLCPLLVDGALVAIDDGNYSFRHTNTAYVNMLRTKMGLPGAQVEDNACRPFHVEAEALLRAHFSEVRDMEGGSYRQTYREDLFWPYYQSDRRAMAELKMEKLDDLAHRFDAWRVRR